MSDLPRITIALFTYSPDLEHPRHRYAEATLTALCQKLAYEGELRWHIADDGSGDGHVAHLAELWARNRPSGSRLTTSNSERRGYGASYNAMTMVVHDSDDDLILCVEDDWLLSRPFDLTPLARAIQAPPFEVRRVFTMQTNDGDRFVEGDFAMPLECIRLGYLGWTKELRGYLIRPIAGQTFLMLDPAASEHHVFSAGPRLETVRFERRLSVWPEHCTAGPCEMAVAARRESRYGVAWPLDQGVNAALDNPSLFAHIGTVSVKDEGVV